MAFPYPLVEYADDYGGYGGGFGPGYDPGYGPGYTDYFAVDYGPPAFVQQEIIQPPPVAYVEESYAPVPYVEPYVEPYGDPYGGVYGDPYGPYVEEVYIEQPYMDQLCSMGYNGPWPSHFYEPRRPRKCRDDSDSDSEDEGCGKRLQKGCHQHHHHHHHHQAPSCQNNGGVTQDDIKAMLDKFETALQLKYKKAHIVELENENERLRDMAKEKKALKREVAQAKRDLLLKEALSFNAGCPVPSKGKPNSQVVSIDFGNNSQPALPAPGGGVGGAAIYSGGVATHQPPPRPVYAHPRPHQAPTVIYH